MADEVIATCSVCGEPMKPYVDGHGSVLLHTASPEHWRIGYKRSQTALAAARREIDRLKERLLRRLDERREAALAAPAAGEEPEGDDADAQTEYMLRSTNRGPR